MRSRHSEFSGPRTQFTFQSRGYYDLKCFAEEERNWERCPEENSLLETLNFEELAVERMKCGLASSGARISVAGVTQQEWMFVQCSLLTSHGYGGKVWGSSSEVHFPGSELAGESGRRAVATELILRTA